MKENADEMTPLDHLLDCDTVTLAHNLEVLCIELAERDDFTEKMKLRIFAMFESNTCPDFQKKRRRQ